MEFPRLTVLHSGCALQEPATLTDKPVEPTPGPPGQWNGKELNVDNAQPP